MSTTPKITIWLWPSGLFPRRILYYLRAKSLTPSLLLSSSPPIHLIPVLSNPSTGNLAVSPAHEPRPLNTTLPCLRVQTPAKPDFFIYESNAILEYLEEIFSTEKGYVDVRGSNPEQRARSRDIVSLLADATLAYGLYLMNSDPSTLSWSGIAQSDWSAQTAAHARKRHSFLLSRLEEWVEEDVVGKRCLSLAGEGTNVTIADFVLMACVVYNEENYGKDWVEDHGILRIWVERVKGEGWCVGKEELRRLEMEGFEGGYKMS